MLCLERIYGKMQTIFSSLKVNNEFELCEIYEEDARKKIEQALLEARISYYMHFPKPKLFSRKRYSCVFCVNESHVLQAEDIVNRLAEEENFEVKMLARKNPNSYL